MTFSGADLLIQLLERQGVRTVAGIPGGALLPLYDALGRSTRITHVLARHEQAAGFMAQGMARLTGRAGVCFATSGPGVTNIVTALADARLDSVPLVCISGQVPQHLIGTDAFQEVPTIDMVKPITKACFFVRDAEELTRIVPKAFRIAESGRPGPVLIDLPKDVQMQVLSTASPAPDRETSVGSCATSSLQNQESLFAAAWDLMERARQPVLYIGGGVVKSRAHLLVRELAELIDTPVTTTLMALGSLPVEHPLCIGMLGMHAARYTNQVIEECDLLIAIGARFDDRATGKPDRFAPRARVIHIDVDPREFGKIRKPTLAIAADAHDALTRLLKHARQQRRAEWLARVSELRASLPLHKPHIDRICSPYGIVHAVGSSAPADAIVSTDVGQHQMWVAQAYPFRRPDRWLTSGGLGTMGFGLPAALGAALAEPDATVICFTGDGSLLMNVQELATLAELDLNVKIIVLDNGALGLVRQQQTLFYRRSLVASHFAQPSNFVAIAQSFGVPAFDLETVAAPHGALARALNSHGPVLIRVPIDADHHVLPMVAPGAANVEAVHGHSEPVME